MEFRLETGGGHTDGIASQMKGGRGGRDKNRVGSARSELLSTAQDPGFKKNDEKIQGADWS